MAATMVASKWTRIVKTQYGAGGNDPCCLVLEMSHAFYGAFLDDMHDATGGSFTFTTEPASTAVLANIGALNVLVATQDAEAAAAAAGPEAGDDAGAALRGSIPHTLPPPTTNRRKRFAITSRPAGVSPPKPAINATALIPYSGNASGAGGLGDDVALAGGLTAADLPLTWKGRKHMSKGESAVSGTAGASRWRWRS